MTSAVRRYNSALITFHRCARVVPAHPHRAQRWCDRQMVLMRGAFSTCCPAAGRGAAATGATGWCRVDWGRSAGAGCWARRSLQTLEFPIAQQAPWRTFDSRALSTVPCNPPRELLEDIPVVANLRTVLPRKDVEIAICPEQSLPIQLPLVSHIVSREIKIQLDSRGPLLTRRTRGIGHADVYVTRKWLEDFWKSIGPKRAKYWVPVGRWSQVVVSVQSVGCCQSPVARCLPLRSPPFADLWLPNDWPMCRRSG